MTIRFISTPDEAQSIALALIDGGFFAGATVEVETAIGPDAPWRTTLLAEGAGPTILVEVQKNPRYDGALRDLARWLSANRHHTQLYLATSDADRVSGEVITNLKRDGSGFIVVQGSGSHEIVLPATCPALQVTPDPTLKLGKLKTEVDGLVKRFNEGERKGALQDMCEAVERETDRLFERALKKGRIVLGPKAVVSALKWANKIEILASPNSCAGGLAPLVANGLKHDLHSFRGARNLVDHPPKTKRDAEKRQQQFTERMMMAPRLLAELIRLQKSVK